MFRIHQTNDGRVPPIEELPSGAITPKVGLALVVTSGKLAVAGATAKPTYICYCEREAAVTAGELIPVIRVEDGMIFGAPCTGDASTLVLGSKVTTENGLAVTTTTTSGVAEVVGVNETEVLVRF